MSMNLTRVFSNWQLTFQENVYFSGDASLLTSRHTNHDVHNPGQTAFFTNHAVDDEMVFHGVLNDEN